MPAQHVLTIHLVILIHLLLAVAQHQQDVLARNNASTEMDCLLLSLYLSKRNSRTGNSREYYINPRSTHWADGVFKSSQYFVESDFQNSFRMSRESFQRLHTLLKPSIEKQTTRFRQPVPSNIRLAILLYHIALGVSYTAISNQFGVGRSTVSGIVGDVSKAIVQVLSKQYIQFPSREEAIRSMEYWRRKSQIPGVVACIDGCHIPIQRPCHSGSTYFNRKGYYSINVQGTSHNLSD